MIKMGLSIPPLLQRAAFRSHADFVPNGEAARVHVATACRATSGGATCRRPRCSAGRQCVGPLPGAGGKAGCRPPRQCRRVMFHVFPRDSQPLGRRAERRRPRALAPRRRITGRASATRRQMEAALGAHLFVAIRFEFTIAGVHFGFAILDFGFVSDFEIRFCASHYTAARLTMAASQWHM